MSAMFAGVAFTVVFSIPALVREIRLARRYESPAAVRPGPQLGLLGFALSTHGSGVGPFAGPASSNLNVPAANGLRIPIPGNVVDGGGVVAQLSEKHPRKREFPKRSQEQ